MIVKTIKININMFNMKFRIYVIVATILFVATDLWSQKVDYYSEVSIIESTEYTYNVSREKFAPAIIRIENSDNTKFNSQWNYRNSNKTVNYELFSQLPHLKDDEMLYDIIREVLTDEEIKSIRNSVAAEDVINGAVSMQVVVSTNGDILEIVFYFKDNQHFILCLHPDKLFSIESLFKQKLKFTIPEANAVEMVDYIVGKNVRIDLRKL